MILLDLFQFLGCMGLKFFSIFEVADQAQNIAHVDATFLVSELSFCTKASLVRFYNVHR